MVKPYLALVTQARCLDWKDQWDADVTALRKRNLPGCRLIPTLALAALHPRAQKAEDGPESPSQRDQAQVCPRDVSGSSLLYLLPSRVWKHYSDRVRGAGMEEPGIEVLRAGSVKRLPEVQKAEGLGSHQGRERLCYILGKPAKSLATCTLGSRPSGPPGGPASGCGLSSLQLCL